MSMRVLVWKEYRQNRRVLAGAGVLLALPYLATAVLVSTELFRAGRLRFP